MTKPPIYSSTHGAQEMVDQEYGEQLMVVYIDTNLAYLPGLDELR